MPTLARNTAVSCLALALTLGGCARSKEGGVGTSAALAPPAVPVATAAQAGGTTPPSADGAGSVARRIVKRASLALTVDELGAAQAAATRIAEREGGFVASTSREAVSEDAGRTDGSVTLTLRVPADHFTAALDALRRLGKGVGSEHVATEDVSEEFIDLEARIHNQRELEAQFIEIMKRAGKIEDALNVQRELATVRTDIERMEGRRRFLEHETALSTLTLVLSPVRPLVSASFSDFSTAVLHASSDTINLGSSIVTGTIRALGVLVPLGVLLALPLWLVVRAVRRRARRRFAAALASGA